MSQFRARQAKLRGFSVRKNRLLHAHKRLGERRQQLQQRLLMATTAAKAEARDELIGQWHLRMRRLVDDVRGFGQQSSSNNDDSLLHTRNTNQGISVGRQVKASFSSKVGVDFLFLTLPLTMSLCRLPVCLSLERLVVLVSVILRFF